MSLIFSAFCWLLALTLAWFMLGLTISLAKRIGYAIAHPSPELVELFIWWLAAILGIVYLLTTN